MISLLERYITKTIIQATIVVTLIITAVLFLMGMLSELKNIGIGDYGISQAILYVILRLPNALYQFSPMFILLGCIIGLSILSSYRELAVMRAAGFSTQHIIFNVLFAGVLLILTISVVGELLAPNLSYKAEIAKENAKNAGQAVVTSAGVWFHVDDNFIHVQHVVGKQLLEGVTRYQFDKQHRLQAAYYAKTMALQNNHWQMHAVVKTSFSQDRTKSAVFASMPWDLKLNPNLFNMGIVEPRDMSLIKLAKFADYLQQNSLQASEYRFAFWQRVLQPFAALIMIFLAIPFVLSTFDTASMGWRIIVGIIVGFVFFILDAILAELCIVYQLPAIFAASLPLVLFTLLGCYLSKRLLEY